MRKLKYFGLAMLLLLALPAVALAAPGDRISNELTADVTVEPEDMTIQGRINKAKSGDTVAVPAGTYDENITIDKPLTLKPADGASVTINGRINIISDGVTVEDFTVVRPENESDNAWINRPVIRLQGKNITIEGNKINGNNSGSGNVGAAGVQVTNGTSATIENNEIFDNPGNGIWVNLSDGDQLTIQGNTIENNRTGVNFDSAGNADVTINNNNTFKNNNVHGISIGSNVAADFTIKENTFEGNADSHFSDRRDDPDLRQDVEAENTFVDPVAWAREGESRWLLVSIDDSAMTLAWADGTDGRQTATEVELTVEQGDQKTAVITAEITEDGARGEGKTGVISQINSVLFVMEITTRDGNAVGGDVVTITRDGSGEPVGYDSTDGFWYWGPRTGFTFSDDATSEFKYTFNEAGEYTITIYAVQLNN